MANSIYEVSVKSTSSRLQQRLLCGEVLSFTPKNAKNRRFSSGFEIPRCGIMLVSCDIKFLKEKRIMANRFVLNEISYHGAGAVKEIVTEAKGRGFRKAFVCSDPDLVKFGVTKKVLDILEVEGLAYELYSEIKPNPTVENVQTGVATYKKSGADYLVAIGGGSSMDTAKAIGIIINNP